jgi:integrase
LALLPHIKEVILHHAKQKNITIPPCNPNNEITLEGLLCTSTADTPIYPKNLRRSFNLMAKQAGFPIIKIHALRHTASTILKDLSVPMKDIQLILGHADISTTMRIYTHGTEKTCTEALNTLGAVLFGNTNTSESHCRIA